MREVFAAIAIALSPGMMPIDMSCAPGRAREIAADVARARADDLAIMAGGDPAKMVDVLNASTGKNNATQKKFKQFVLSRHFDSGFGLDLVVKDLTIALDVGREADTATSFATLCREMWAGGAVLLGLGQDHTVMTQLSERMAGEVLARWSAA